MARSYVLNFVHCVFSTKGRTQLIRDPESLWAYMRGIARNRGFEILAVGGTNNHVHALISIPANKHVVDVIRDLKANSSALYEIKCSRIFVAGWVCRDQRQTFSGRDGSAVHRKSTNTSSPKNV
jgi:REP element-mobilizing transposase RayT